VPNLVIAKVGAGGQVCIYSLQAADVIVDVTGYFPATSGFTPITNPQRVLDTRSGVGAAASKLAGGQTVALQVGGVAGVPPDAKAVVITTTVTGPTGPGFLTVFPCGQPQPLASNLNYVAGQTVPNSVIAKLGAGGQVCLSTFAAADLVVDVAGYFPAGSSFTPIPNPRRILDTRPGECRYPAAAPGVNPHYGCVASIRVDMDGDGTPDPFIVYSETQDPKAIAEVDEWAAVQIHGTWYSYHVGAVDLLGTDTAVFKYGSYDTTPGDEVLYTNNVGAHIMSGGVLAWSPTAGLELLPDGWTVDAGLYFGTGQRCVAGGVDIINYDTNFDAANNPISAVISVDHDVWQGRRLATSTTDKSTVALASGQYAGDLAFGGHDSFDCPQLLEPFRMF